MRSQTLWRSGELLAIGDLGRRGAVIGDGRQTVSVVDRSRKLMDIRCFPLATGKDPARLWYFQLRIAFVR
jgi:hypothetical protein